MMHNLAQKNQDQSGLKSAEHHGYNDYVAQIYTPNIILANGSHTDHER